MKGLKVDFSSIENLIISENSILLVYIQTTKISNLHLDASI